MSALRLDRKFKALSKEDQLLACAKASEELGHVLAVNPNGSKRSVERRLNMIGEHVRKLLEVTPPSEWYDLDKEIHCLRFCYDPIVAYPAQPHVLAALDYTLSEIERGEHATFFSLWDEEGRIGNYIVATVDFDNYFKKRAVQS